MTLRRKFLLAVALSIPLAVLAVQLFFGRALAAAAFRRQLLSPEPRQRVEGRDGLLELGHPAIDSSLPLVVAVNGLDEAASGGAVVVARSIEPRDDQLILAVESVLVATDPRALDPTSKNPDLIHARDERVSPAAARLTALVGADPVSRGRALAVVGQRDGKPVLRSAVALEGDLGARIEAEVKAELARRRQAR